MRVPDFRKIIDFPKHFQERFGKLAAKLHKQHIKTMKRPSGSAFKKLSKRYKQFKMKKVGRDVPDLKLSGAMLNEFKFQFAIFSQYGEFRVQYGILKNKKYPGKNVGTAEVMNIHAEGIGTMPARPVSQPKHPIYNAMKADLVEAIAEQVATNISKVLKVHTQVIRV